MFDDKFYSELQDIVRAELSCSAHDLSHVGRVYQNALNLTKHEKYADLDVIKTAALLHDIARVREDTDATGETDHAVLGAYMAEEILKNSGCPDDFIQKVKSAIIKHRFKGNNVPETIEEKIIFDADKLDILGAVGLARSFIITGEYGQPIYSNINTDDYIRDNLTGGSKTGRIKDMRKHSANLEFEIKIKKIPERMFTDTGKRMAQERLKFMDNFFNVLKEETVIENFPI